MAAAIEREFGLSSDFVGGHGGIFEVSLDGEIAYTNGSCCGIPSDDEVLDALRSRIA